MHRRCLLVVLTMIIVGSGCATKPKIVGTDPFLIPKNEFRSQIKIIGLAPVGMIEGHPEPESIAAEFDSLLVAGLHKMGYSVIRPQQYKAVWAQLAADSGGFLDPDTGKRDEERMAVAMFETIERLDADFKLDAAMFPDIVVVEAQFAGGRAVWDGAQEKIQTGGAMSSVFSGSQHGVLGALSLKLSVRGTDGTLLFVNSGGIEVLDRLSGKELVPVPRQELFTDKKRNRESVKIALKPLKR
ncbi:MAG: hypothetical protein P8181_09865 [bacterium]